MNKSYDNFLESSKKLFVYYKELGEKTMSQLADESLLYREHEECNSIAMIVKHMHGNMLSRWTDFLDTDGEKSWRNRDGEFEETVENREEMMTLWEEGWACLFQALESIDSENESQLVYIRNEGHTVVEAVQRQLTHYAYHIGQIVYVGKSCASNKWESLSIPKKGSEKYNHEKFLQERKKSHFTDKI